MTRAAAALALLVTLGTLGSLDAQAQPADVPALAKLIETQPPDLDRATWKEKRRDAARKLAQSRDKKATPTLIKLANEETFDIIGEIAIEGLGNLGDPSAVPVLQKIAADPARDKVQRELAAKSLRKLGASATGPAAPVTPPPVTPPPVTPPPVAPDPPPTTGPEPTGLEPATPAAPIGATAGAAAGGALIGERGGGDLPALPELPEDTIAAYERLQLVGGTANLAYDTVRERLAFDVDAAGRYTRRVEREKLAYGWDTSASVIGGVVNPSGREQVRGAVVDVAGAGEVRFYAGKLYGVGKAAANVQVNYTRFQDDDNPDDDFGSTRMIADLQIALGVGYGRVIDVGGAIRIRRLARTLDAARALGRPIDPATARRLELTWWALRGERSTYRALLATVAILREAGVLLGEPDAGLSFEILQVLQDTQLFLRPSGLDLQLAIGEGYLRRPEANFAGQRGRVEQLLLSAGYGIQLDEDRLELSGTGYGRVRLFAPDMPPDAQPSPWAFGVGARARRFTYGPHGEPFGVFDLAADIRVADDDPLNIMDTQLGMRFATQLGFTYLLNQASGIRLAATLAIDGGELFFGASLQATLGLLDATFAGI